MEDPTAIGKRLDISIGPPPTVSTPKPSAPVSMPDETDTTQRPFVGILFQCCGAYSRVFINRAGDGYQGNCPKCSKPVKLRIAPGGSDARFFEVF